MPHGGDEHTIGISWIHHDARDVVSVGQAQRLPRSAAVRGAIDACAVREVFAELRFTATDVDDVRVGRCNRDGAHRRDVRLAIGQVAPGLTAIRGLPHSTIDRAEIEDHRLARIPGDRDRTSTPERPDEPPPKRLEPWRRGRGFRKQRGIIRQIHCLLGCGPSRCGTLRRLCAGHGRTRYGGQNRELQSANDHSGNVGELRLALNIDSIGVIPHA